MLGGCSRHETQAALVSKVTYELCCFLGEESAYWMLCREAEIQAIDLRMLADDAV